MSDKRSSTDRWVGLLNELADDVLSLSDEEVRTEVREAGESLEDYSAEFRRALRGARARVAERRSASGFLPISAAPFSPESLAGFPSVQEADEPYGAGWRASRRVVRYRGALGELLELLPEFEEAPFTADPVLPPHPDRRMVVRKPDSRWAGMAVGAVSDSYALVQHREAVETCLGGLEMEGLRAADLDGELSLSEFGEWMNFTLDLSRHYEFHDDHGHEVALRCEVANSVDGSSPLHVWFDWFRPVCSNGLVLGRRKAQRKLHRSGMDLDQVRRQASRDLREASWDARVLREWQVTPVYAPTVFDWAGDHVRQKWGSSAAGRVESICRSGHDPEFQEPSRDVAPFIGQSRRRRVRKRVPGSPEVAETKYDVAQAMSWVASRTANVVDRVRRQGQIPGLIKQLPAA